MKNKFNSEHSKLELDQKKIKEYVTLLEKKLGNNFKIDGIIEIGSYAKGEAVPKSDIDTRIYVSSPNFYIWQTSGSRLSDKRQKEMENKFKTFVKKNKKEIFVVDWYNFNEQTANEISKKINLNVEFGLTDSRFANYELSILKQKPSPEHQLLLESNIIYDPVFFLKKNIKKIKNKKYQTIVKLYKERYLNNLPFEIYTHIKSHKKDNWKLQKSQQIQWLKWAVRSIRDAVGTKNYIKKNVLLFKKTDILKFCSQNLSPQENDFVKELYDWKTNPKKRTELVEDFIKNQKKYFKIFKEKTKEIEKIVNKIKKI